MTTRVIISSLGGHPLTVQVFEPDASGVPAVRESKSIPGTGGAVEVTVWGNRTFNVFETTPPPAVAT